MDTTMLEVQCAPPPSSSQPATTSPLLKLPFELRSQIYSLVLGGGRFNLIYRTKDLSHAKRIRPDQINTSGAYGYIKTADFWRKWPGDGDLPLVNTALLQTCRQIFKEAVSYLYSSNVFNIHEGEQTLFATIRHIAIYRAAIPAPSSAYLCKIRRLEVDWRFQNLPTKAAMIMEEVGEIKRTITWTIHWQSVAKDMPGLRVLYVCLEIAGHLLWTVGEEMHFARPLLQIGNLETCKVFLIQKAHIIIGEDAILLEELGDGMCTPDVSMCIQKPLDSYPTEKRPWIAF